MLSLSAAELKRNFGANLSIDRVRTESWIFEKVMKCAQQFSTPGKSLENGDKVWKNGYRSWVFFFKATRSALEMKFSSFCSNVSHSNLPVCLQRTMKKLCSCILKISVDHLPWVWKKKLLLWKKVAKDSNFGSRNLYESCIDLCSIDIRVTVEFINLSYYWH